MCGIVYAHDFWGNPVNNGILQVFDKQRSRGTEGFGLYDGDADHIVHTKDENKILKWLVKYDSSLIMFHHRWPTSTINVEKAAHPFSTKNYFGTNQYILVHNGQIFNAQELYKKHRAMGIKYQSWLGDGKFNDSEALLWDLALVLEGKQEKLEARGTIAFVCMKKTDGALDKLYFARNTNPLNMFRSKNGIALSSEGEGEAIDSHTLYSFNYKLKRLTSKFMSIPGYVYERSTQHMPYSYPDSNYDDGDNDWPIPVTKGTPNEYGGTDTWGARKRHDEQKKLSDKFTNYFAGKDAPDLYDYDKDGNPVAFSNANNACGQMSIGDLDDEYAENTPEAKEVSNRVFEYLKGTDGNFDDAYWQAEDDYASLMDWPETPAIIKEIKLLEHVMYEIESDPEYQDMYSVSSMWTEAELWNAVKTA